MIIINKAIYVKNKKKKRKYRYILIVQVYKKKPMVYNFCSISDITIEDVGSFTCELKGGNIIKQRQSIFILSTSLKIHHTKTVICFI